MERKIPRLYPSAQVENNDLEQGLGNEKHDVNGF